jgi:hypothetical protein
METMSELHFGYCDIITTPPETMGLAGYSGRNDHGFNNNGVHDDLYARALCLKSGDTALLLITVDMCLIDEKTGDMIRERISEKTGLPVDHIMLCLSHTHSGPAMIKGHLNRSDSPEASERIDSYTESLAAKIVTISSQACSINLKGKIYSATFVAQVGYNRRSTCKDENGGNAVKMLFSNWLNPAAETNGPVDTNLPILMVERVDEAEYDPYLSAAGTDRVVLFNVPAHPVVMGPLNRYVSADYPGAARRCIESTLGDGTKAMFVLGACGNVNALMACQNNFKCVEVVGNTVGNGVCAALSMRKEIEFDELKAVSENVATMEGAVGKRIVTQVFKIGKAAIAAVSCENFTELGLRIREESQFDQTLVATNSNGGYGYIPTGDVMRNWSGYEVDSAIRMGFDENLHDRMVETVVKNLKLLNA